MKRRRIFEDKVFVISFGVILLTVFLCVHAPSAVVVRMWQALQHIELFNFQFPGISHGVYDILEVKH